MSQSLGDYRLQNGSQLWLNGGDYPRQNGGASESHNRGRGSADFLRQNGDHADHVLRQNGGNDAKRSSGETGGASIEPQHRRLNGDYGQQNGGEEGGETAYPGRSEQYARNWPPVSQSPADKLQSKKVRERKNTNGIREKVFFFFFFFTLSKVTSDQMSHESGNVDMILDRFRHLYIKENVELHF